MAQIPVFPRVFDGYFIDDSKEYVIERIENDLKYLFSRHKVKKNEIEDVLEKIYAEYCIQDVIE